MGFTASYAGYSFYCTINGTYTIKKQQNLNSYLISYTYYWYMKVGDINPQWQKNDFITVAQIPANIYSIVYARVKQDISADYQIVDDL